ncbi:MAG TPA: hypothetical protein VKE74_05975 [Gemmataceae bacterium]|nr:hypothetical protein [Gemmataceae bacterium]
MLRLKAPVGNGEVLAVPGFDEIPRLVEENRRRLDRDDVKIAGLPLRELRAQARREVLDEAWQYARWEGFGRDRPEPLCDGPLLLAGHQPELAHPGVWVKNFALNGLARKLGGTPLHLIVDNDTLKTTSLRFPVFRAHDPASVHLQSVALDRPPAGLPYEYALVQDEGLFASFAERVAPLIRNWPFAPLLQRIWPKVVAHQMPWVGEKFTFARRTLEQDWGGGNCELAVSHLTELESFACFVRQLLEDLPRFAGVYNAAVNRYRVTNRLRSDRHPVPDLVRKDDWLESPLWGQQHGGYHHARRGRVFANAAGTKARVDDGPDAPIAEAIRNFCIRPRALTLTLFARVCLGDFFIHGIGGGKYDEVTDAIIRDYFGIEPPAYQVLSATLHLPLPGFPATADDVKQAERRVRDLIWNPQRHLSPADRDNPEVQSLLAAKAALAANEPPVADHAARRNWFRDLQRVTARLGPFVAGQLRDAEAALARTRAEARANAILLRRDYSWVLYPEETLKPFLQQFLNQ